MNDNFAHTNISNIYFKYLHHFLNGSIIYVENQENREVLDYLRKNIKEIQLLFETKDKNFIIAFDIINVDDDLKDVISYFYPGINLDAFDFSTFNINQYLLEKFNFKGKVKNGLLSIDDQILFTDLSSVKIGELKQFLTQYVKDISTEEFDDLPLSGNNNQDSKISIDEETQEIINAIFNKFNILKENGNLINILPIIENYIKENKAINIESLSPVLVDDDYRIYLTEYNNLEIKLSHLTKCVYLLFLNHKEGIHLKELTNYKEELMGYYKHISYRIDYNKMLASVNEIINTETNAIYVHLSRIKSFFIRNLHPNIAQNYYIQGDKNKPKSISLDRNLLLWKH